MSSATPASIHIGVLALQGSFAEHVGVIKILAPSFLPTILTASAVRTPEQLALCQGLIIPGGESSAISLIIQSSRLLEPLREFVQRAKHGQGAVWGTCAGMILLASDVVGSLEGYEGLNGFDIKVVRNQFGRQAESFQHALEMPLISPDPFTAVFIRAPVMHSILPNAKPPVEVVATVPFECLPVPVDRFAARDGTTVIPAVPLGKDANICMARQGGLFISSFHPELGGDNRVHEWFVKTMVIPNSEA